MTHMGIRLQQILPGRRFLDYDRRWVWAAGATFLLVLVPFLFPVFNEETMIQYGDSYSLFPLVLMVSVAALFRRSKEKSPEARRFWAYLGIGFTCWLLGQGLWLIGGQQGLVMAMVADTIYLLLYLFFLLALEQHPDDPPSTAFERVLNRYTRLGGLILLGTAFVYFTLIPGIIDEAAYQTWKPSALSSLFLDSYFAIRLIALWRRSRQPVWKARFGWLAIALLIWVVVDLLFFAAVQYGRAGLVSGPFSVLIWHLPFIPALAACLLKSRPLSESIPEAKVADPDEINLQPPVGRSPLLFYAFLMPCLHMGFFIFGWLDFSLNYWRELLLLIETLVMAILVFRVHGLVFKENERLREGYEALSLFLAGSNKSLAGSIQDRTRELEELNGQLASDIQARTRVEDRLRNSESRNQALILAIPDSLFVVDRKSRITEALPVSGFDDMHAGLDLVGTSFEELFVALGPQGIGEIIEQVLPAGEMIAIPCSSKSGSDRRQFECRFSPLGPEEVLVLVQDVTRRLEVERVMQQTQKMESLGVMAGGIAHDFNNLLVGILGNVRLARETLDSENALTKPLSVIEKSAVRAAKLTENLLAYAGKADIELRPVNLRELIMELESVLAAAIPGNCLIQLELDQEPMWVLADEAQITQILLNLVVNAGEALGDQGGDIRVSLERQEPESISESDDRPSEVDCSNSCIILRVQDGGCGMDLETRRRIFDPFFTSKASGRGLGLAPVLGMMVRFKGTITVDSRPGEGSEFIMTFPSVESEDSEPVATAVPHQGPIDRGTILVADDELDVRDLMGSYLSQLGFTVITVENGEDAVGEFKRHQDRIRVVLLDFAMPRMNGVDALFEIRKTNPAIPVVMMSGYHEGDVMTRLKGQPMIRFIHKPFDLKEFLFLTNDNWGFSLEAKG